MEKKIVSKLDRERIAALIDEINHKFGNGSLYTIGNGEGTVEIPRTSTGIPGMDEIIGGGLPNGRIIEFYGTESAGKTSLAYHLASQYEMVLFLDLEKTFLPSQAKIFGNKENQMYVHRPDWGEQAFDDAYKFASAGCPLIVLDSVPLMIPQKAMEEENMGKNAEVAGTARLFSRNLPKLNDMCQKTGTTVILINQVRDKMNAMPFGDPYTTPGGRMIKHLGSLRIKLARKSTLAIDGYKFGQICRLKVEKSKVSVPFGETELMLIYNRGFLPQEDLPEIRKAVKEQIRALAKAKKSIHPDLSPLEYTNDEEEEGMEETDE